MKPLPYGTRVKIVGITDAEDKDLNGVTGILRRKFTSPTTKHVFGDVGIKADPHFNIPFLNVMWNEVKEIYAENYF